jgi:hypothetical protein
MSTAWGRITRLEPARPGVIPRGLTLLPIVIVATWWTLCFAFYVSGWPIQYNRGNVGLVALLFGSTLVLVIGTFFFIVRSASFERSASSVGTGKRLPWIMVVAVVAIVALYAPLAEAYSGFHFWQVLPALANQSVAYELASMRISEGLGARIGLVLIQTVLSPITLAALPYLAFRWFESRRHLIPLVIVVLLAVFTSILGGRDFQLVLSAILVAIAWMAARVRRGVGFGRVDVVVLGGGALLGIVLFGLRKQSRMLDRPYCPEGADVCAIPNAPTLWDTITVTVSSYLSQGFEGLGRALDASCGGYSHSPALVGLVENFTGAENESVVTAQLNNLDWSATANWSTGFAMIANDVPWVVVPFVVAIGAALLAVAWRATIVRGDWLSVAVFAYSFVGLFFMPMNLQLAISGPLYLGYLALVGLFVIRLVVEALRTREGNTGGRPERPRWAIAGRPVF